MNCINSWNCSGQMVITCIHDKGDIYVAAHKLTTFAQCNSCGTAPLPQDQPEIVKHILNEQLKTIESDDWLDTFSKDHDVSS